MTNIEKRNATAKGFQELVAWAVRQELVDIPIDVRKQTVMVIADDLAAMLSAENEPQVMAYQNQMIARGPTGSASLFRLDQAQLAPLQAALGNALSGSWNELDEGYRKAVCHAGLYILPALMAIAESEKIPTAEVLRATTLAYEITARFARTWRFSALSIHPHALFNAVGAAAGIGFLRRLTAQQMIDALSNASTLGVVGPYNQAVRGALIRNAWAAAGIFNGFQAIEWAEAGISGLLDTPHAVYHEMLGSEAHPEDLTLDLGQDWAISSGYHKMNACCQYAHSAIEAVQETLQHNPQLLGGDEVVKIEIETHPLGMTLNNFKPVTTLGAKFSLPHALAAAVVFGDGNAQSFGTDSLLDERVTRLRERVDMRLVSEQLPWPQDRPAFVTLVDTKGRRYQAHCMSARGGSDRPFTDEQLWSKIDSLSSASAPSLMQVMQSLHAQCDIQPASKEWSQPWRNLVDQFFKPVPNPSTFHLNDA